MSQFINLDNSCTTPFELYENLYVENEHNSINFTGNFSTNKLTDMFFSKININNIQKTIITEIYKKTKGIKISKQSEDELLIVMKSIYLQYGRNNSSSIKKQIENLNNRVLEYCINNVYMNLKQYNKYIEDITSEKTTLDFPENVNIKGDKTLMPNHFF